MESLVRCAAPFSCCDMAGLRIPEVIGQCVAHQCSAALARDDAVFWPSRQASSASSSPVAAMVCGYAGIGATIKTWAVGRAPARSWRGRSSARSGPRAIIKVDATVDALLGHRFHNHGTEPAPLRRRHGQTIALGPAHGEGVPLDPPAHVDAPRSVESAPYFPALAASSWSTSPMACAEAAFKRSLGPSTAIRCWRTWKGGRRRDLPEFHDDGR
jgi:hypothetical protein